MNKNKRSPEIDAIIQQYTGWKADIIKELREIIFTAHPDIIEEVKWKMPSNPKGLPIWSHKGIVCMVQTFKNDTKLVFFKGAFLEDKEKVFNARLNSKTDRAIEFHEGDKVDKDTLKALVIRAVECNDAKGA